MVPKALIPWAALAVVLAMTASFFYGLKVGNDRLESYKMVVRAVGEAQEARTAQRIAADKQRKVKTDEQVTIDRKRIAALSRSLRDERARGRFVPAAPASAASPDTAKVNRAELERALQQLDAGVSELIAEGDQGRVDLDAAKGWAQD